MNNFGNQVTGVNGQLMMQPQQQMQAQVANNAPVQQQVIPTQQQGGSQALFSQEQLNSIISGRINPLNQKIQDLNQQLAQAQQLSQSYLTELTSFKHKEAALMAGVPSQFVDFAVFEASKLAVNGKSFEDAIKEFVTTNGQLLGLPQQNVQTQVVATPAATNVTQGVANPAQNIQTQQMAQNTQVVGNNNGGATNQQQIQQSHQPQLQQQVQMGTMGNNVTGQVVGMQPVQQGVAQLISSAQYGATGTQLAGNANITAGIDGQVEAFLKERGLKK